MFRTKLMLARSNKKSIKKQLLRALRVETLDSRRLLAANVFADTFAITQASALNVLTNDSNGSEVQNVSAFNGDFDRSTYDPAINDSDWFIPERPGQPGVPQRSLINGAVMFQDGRADGFAGGGNRGDVDLLKDSDDDPSNDTALTEANRLLIGEGMLLASLRDNSPVDAAGTNLAVIQYQTEDGAGATTWVAQGAAPENNGENSAYFSAAFFPYADGWTGGSYDTGAVATSGGAGITATGSGGRYEVEIAGVTDSFQEGFLFGIGGDNEDNYTRTQPIEGGKWRIQHRDNAAEIGGAEGDNWNVLYVPRSTQGLIGGVVDGTTPSVNPMKQSFGEFTIQRESDGFWRLSVPGGSPTEGVLIMETYDTTVDQPRNAYFSYDQATTGNTDDFVIRQFAWDNNTETPLNTDFVFFYVPFENTLNTAAPLTVVDLGTAANPSSNLSEANIALGINADGTVSYDVGDAISALGEGQTQTDTFVYSATDGTETNSATVTVQWTGVNDAPTVEGSIPTQTFNEDDAPVTIDLSPLFADVDTGDVLTYTVDPGLGGILSGTINGNMLEIGPSPDQFGATIFSVTATDQAGASATITVAATVFGQDDAPSAVDDVAQTDKITAIDIDALSNDFHPETSAFSVAAGVVTADSSATDNAGSQWSVSASTPGPNELTIQSGPNLGDVAVGRNGVDLSFAEGVLLGTAREAVTPFATVNAYAAFGSYGFATDSALGQAAGTPDARAERNSTISTAFFPFAEGWTSGHFSNDGTLLGGVGISQADIVKLADGLFEITIPEVSGAADTAGVLFAMSAANEDNVMSVLPSATNNTWLVRQADSDNLDPNGFEDDNWSFVFVPATAPNLLGGSWRASEDDDGQLIESFGGVTATQAATKVSVTIPGFSAAEGALIAIVTDSAVADIGGTITTVPDASIVLATPDGNNFSVEVRDGVSYGEVARDFEFIFLPFSAPLERLAGLDLSISAVDATSSLGATVTINADGTINYDPTLAGGVIAGLQVGESVQDTFTYTLTDSRAPAQTDTATVTVTVTGENQAPTANEDRINLNENSAVGAILTVLGNDVDPDFDAIYGQPIGVASANLTVDASSQWSVAQTGAAPGNISVGANGLGDVEILLDGVAIPSSDGVVLATVRQNADGLNTEYRLVQAYANSTGGTSLSLQQFGADALADADVALSYFRFVDNWIGGHVDSLGVLSAGSGLAASDVVRTATGRYQVSIPGVTDAARDGFLFVIGNEQADNVASARAIPGTGIYEVAVRDNTQDFADGEDGGFSLVFVPRNAENLVAGAIDASSAAPNAVSLGIGEFSIERQAVGTGGNEWKLTIPGQTPESGVLLLTNQDNSEIEDNFLSYESGGDGSFLIRSHDMPGLGRQDQPFTFMFIPFADPGLPVARPVPGPLSISSVDATSALGATLTANPDGTISYDPGTLFEALYTGDTNTDSFTYTMTDGFGGSDTATVTVVVSGVGEVVQFLPSAGPTGYGPGDPAVGIDSFLTITNPDLPFLDGATMTVGVAAGVSPTDLVAIRNEGTGVGQIGVNGADVTFEGTVIGSFSGGTGSAPLVVTLNPNATLANVQLLSRAITFANTDTAIPLGQRSISFAFVDGNGRAGAEASKVVEIGLLRSLSLQEGVDYGYGVYDGAADVEISQSEPDGVANAAGDILIDYNADGSESQALLKFENIFGTEPGQIPAGAIITSANLVLETNPNTANSPGDGARFLRMLEDWDESATWNSLGLTFDLNDYNLSGVRTNDVQARAVHESAIGTESGAGSTGTGVFTLSVLPDIRAWASGDANFGWVFKGWELRTDGWFFSSSEDETPMARPRLDIEWLPADQVNVASFRDGVDGYSGTIDTQISAGAPDDDLSASETLFVDDPNVQTLIRFEEIFGNAAGQIPAGSTIVSAQLRTASTTSSAQGDGGRFFPILVDWQDTSTWNSLTDGIAADGTDALTSFNTAAGDASRNPNVQGGFSSWDVTQDLQNWVDGTLANQGWAITPWEGGTDGWGIRSSESPLEFERPVLDVYFVANSEVPSSVASRGLFYNDSAFDGDAASSTNDNAAMASDKSAYLPGSGTATFANYTSYSRGINGVVIDFDNLVGTPTADDFVFRVGNDQTPGDWVMAPAPTSVAIRAGDGVGGSTRVSLVWADNAIQNQWLQITVLANDNTGLIAPDVHYWGNQIGETGNVAGDTAVNADDATAVRNNTSGFQLVDVTNDYDINRDRRVNVVDHAIIQSALTSGDSIVLLNLASGGNFGGPDDGPGDGPSDGPIGNPGPGSDESGGAGSDESGGAGLLVKRGLDSKEVDPIGRPERLSVPSIVAKSSEQPRSGDLEKLDTRDLMQGRVRTADAPLRLRDVCFAWDLLPVSAVSTDLATEALGVSAPSDDLASSDLMAAAYDAYFASQLDDEEL